MAELLKKDNNHKQYLKHIEYFKSYGNKIMNCEICNKDIKRHNWHHHQNAKYHLKMIDDAIYKRTKIENELRDKLTEELTLKITEELKSKLFNIKN